MPAQERQEDTAGGEQEKEEGVLGKTFPYSRNTNSSQPKLLLQLHPKLHYFWHQPQLLQPT